MENINFYKPIKEELKKRNLSYNELLLELRAATKIRKETIKKVMEKLEESGKSIPHKPTFSNIYDEACKNILEEKKGNRMVWSIKLIIASIVISIILFLINFYIKP
jgi:hypothetical protein